MDYHEIMKKRLEQRLQTLRTELESGQNVLAELELKQAAVRDTLLRISGAIQVLEEELAKGDDEVDHSSGIDFGKIVESSSL